MFCFDCCDRYKLDTNVSMNIFYLFTQNITEIYIEFIFRDVLLNVLKRLNTKSIDTQLCVTFDFGSAFHAELEDTKVTSVMHFFGINFFIIYGS